MSDKTLAIDAMGGDHGPEVTVPASVQVLHRHPGLNLILVGDEQAIQRVLDRVAGQQARQAITVRHTTQVIDMDEPPAQALRHKKDASMRVAIDAVKSGQAQACVSAGNTGALMAIARLVLRTLPGVARPAIMSGLPTFKDDKQVYMLDLGANVDSQAQHLLQFAIMGTVTAASVKGVANPSVALLNVGEEEIKGNEQVKQTAKLLEKTPALNYAGFVEGDTVFNGDVDIVVCDGFVGNVTLKSVEGVAKLMASFIRDSFTQNWLARMLGLMSSPILKDIRERINPDHRNGANMLGLQGIVLKSHGGAHINAFSSAVEKAVIEAEANLPQRISEEVANLLSESEPST